MKSKPVSIAAIIFAIVFVFNAAHSVKAVELITNGGFENATAFSGWFQGHIGCTDNGTSYFPPTVVSPYAPDSSGASISAFAGTRSAFNPWTCGPSLAVNVYYSPVGGYTLSQDVTVPASNSITLSFTDSLYTNLAFYPSPDWRSARPKQYRVEIRNTSNVVLATPYTLTAPANTLTNIPWTTHSFNLGTAYAGQTIRLVFVWTTTTGFDAPGKVGLDNVSIDALVPTAADASITGRVSLPGGRGISRATLRITDSQTGEVKSATTNPFGYYRFTELETGHFYIVNVARKGYIFEPDNQSFQINDNLDGINFVGSQPQ